jgi:AAHS family 4-hydroxybenzoate transporter-like MFS transporter
MSTVNVADLIDRSRLGAAQIGVLALCALCLVIDGFDVQAMGYVAPAIIRQWGIVKADLGPVFGAGLVGMTVGALVLGPVADRIGRRPVLIGAMLALAVCMAATAQASSVRGLLGLRFATGVGMGAIIPNAVALAGEFSPGRFRVSLMMITSSGFILGGALGGAVAATIIPAWGWPAVFMVGAAAPLMLAIAMLLALPESIQFLAMKGRRPDVVLRWVARLGDPGAIDAGTQVVVHEVQKEGAPVARLFGDGLGVGTVLLWAVNFMNLLAAYFLANWLPVLMAEAGHGPSQAVLAGTVFWVGGMIGNLLLGWFVDRRGFGLTLSMTFAAAAVSIALIGQVAPSMMSAFAGIAAAGFFVLGGQTALNALAAVYYPTDVRSTGIAWALGIGRLGSILGPVVGGELLRLNWETSNLFLAAAMPAILALASVLLFWRTGRLPLVAASARAGSRGTAHAAPAQT